MSNIIKLIQESIIFSDKSISIDFDKFLSGRIKKLLIVGFSGSGKTSTGKQISKIYSKSFFKIDDCWNFKLKNPIKQFDKCLEYKLLNKKIYILEGINFMDLKAYPNIRKFILKQPCIILGRSSIISSIKAAIRNKNYNQLYKNESYYKNLKRTFNTNKHIFNNYNIFKRIRCNQPNANIQNFDLNNLSKDDIQW